MAVLQKPAEARRRRNASPSDAVLPAHGPRSRPRWPLGSPSEDEAALWRSLWRRPVAHVWVAQRIEPSIIARYVTLALTRPLNPALSAQLSALENALGLTPAAMARLRLRVEDAPAAPPVHAVPDNIEKARRRYEGTA